LTDLAIATVQDFLKQYPHKPDQFLIQKPHGVRLSKNTAHHWMDALIKKLKQSKEPILIDKGFGWHGFRRTFTRRFLAQGGNIFDLKAIAGWTFTSTISHYLGDSKRTEPNPKPPLIFKRRAVAA
jgi:integrase